MGNSDLDVLDPPDTRVRVGGVDVVVKPLTIGQLPRFVRAIQPAMPQLSVDGDLDWVTLVAEHGEGLIAAAAVATGLEPKDIEALPPDEFVVLCGTLFEANMDFFVRRLAPAMERVSDRIVAAMEAGTGEIRSKH
jgi:hypothetical protein